VLIDPVENNLRMNEVHDSAKKVRMGYCAFPNERSMAVDATDLDEGAFVKELTLNVVLGETSSEEAYPGASVSSMNMALAEGKTFVNNDIRWDLADANGGTVRRGPSPLRYGYYFILGEPSELKLFCATTTPEHMRLVAQSYGEPRKAMLSPTKSLSYVVIRISEA